MNAVVKGCEKSCARQRTCYNHEKGREIMCESVEKYADKKSEIKRINALAEAVKMLMKTTSVSVEQAFSNLGIADSDRKLISKQLSR